MDFDFDFDIFDEEIPQLKTKNKVVLLSGQSGKYIIETSSNFNENPKIEQFILSKSDDIYNFYVEQFKEMGVWDA